MVIPWQCRALAVALLVTAAMGWAWLKGADHVQVQFDAYAREVETAGNAQLAKNKQVAKAGVDISKQNGSDYEKSLASLNAGLTSERVRDSSRGRKAAPVSDAGPQIAGRSSDIALGAGITTPAPDECQALKGDAARTTLEYLWLRDWLYTQKEAWDTLTAPGN